MQTEAYVSDTAPTITIFCARVWGGRRSLRRVRPPVSLGGCETAEEVRALRARESCYHRVQLGPLVRAGGG
eukprot:1046063-Pyramimonas_sp.AAC.1